MSIARFYVRTIALLFSLRVNTLRFSIFRPSYCRAMLVGIRKSALKVWFHLVLTLLRLLVAHSLSRCLPMTLRPLLYIQRCHTTRAPTHWATHGLKLEFHLSPCQQNIISLCSIELYWCSLRTLLVDIAPLHLTSRL